MWNERSAVDDNKIYQRCYPDSRNTNKSVRLQLHICTILKQFPSISLPFVRSHKIEISIHFISLKIGSIKNRLLIKQVKFVYFKHDAEEFEMSIVHRDFTRETWFLHPRLKFKILRYFMLELAPWKWHRDAFIVIDSRISQRKWRRR